MIAKDGYPRNITLVGVLRGRNEFLTVTYSTYIL